MSRCLPLGLLLKVVLELLRLVIHVNYKAYQLVSSESVEVSLSFILWSDLHPTIVIGLLLFLSLLDLLLF